MKKYSEIIKTIEHLEKFDWWDSGPLTNKLLPSILLLIHFSLIKLVKFLSPISFWFLVCS